ncbi:MAG: type II toxin-antitoxin system death-on-curing family toxin [Pseudomonadota bacterium]
MSTYIWPDNQAILDDFADYFSEIGQELQIVSKDDLQAGFDRVRNAFGDKPDADAAELAALIFESVSSRHALVDGNKRLAWQAMTVFLDMNGVWFDAPEKASFDIAMAVVEHTKTVEHLAEFIREHTSTEGPEALP